MSRYDNNEFSPRGGSVTSTALGVFLGLLSFSILIVIIGNIAMQRYEQEEIKKAQKEILNNQVALNKQALKTMQSYNVQTRQQYTNNQPTKRPATWVTYTPDGKKCWHHVNGGESCWKEEK